jgi:hypothetical protein
MEGDCCKTCKYYKHTVFSVFSCRCDTNIVTAFCRRYPNIVFKKDDDWCGEYQLKEQIKV